MANIPSSPIFVTLMMEALSSSEMLVLTRATRRNIPEDAILLGKISREQSPMSGLQPNDNKNMKYLIQYMFMP
jgi:hypothetical protein